MSSRQIVFLLTCLWGMVWAASVVQAQVSSYVSPTRRTQATQGPARGAEPKGERRATVTQRPQETHGAEPGPASVGHQKPTAIHKEGFIQQLRALPESSVQVLQEAEDRQFRLPPRSNQARTNTVRRAQVNMQAPAAASQNAPPQSGNNLPLQPTARTSLQNSKEPQWMERMNHSDSSSVQMSRATQTMPTTYRGLQNRPASSNQLFEGPSRFYNPNQTWDEPGDEPEFVETEFLDSNEQGFANDYSDGELAEPIVTRITDERNEEEQIRESRGENIDERLAPQRRPDIEYQLTEEPRNNAFDALTTDSLQRAPRVSRVPLPRPAAMVNESLESVSLPEEDSTVDAPARIVATPTSATPHL
ncbi:MAG: hypothetical protein ABI557_19150, partial [Aureliella sp.]